MTNAHDVFAKCNGDVPHFPSEYRVFKVLPTNNNAFTGRGQNGGIHRIAP